MGSERRFYISPPSETRQILLRDGPVIIWNWLQHMSGIDKLYDTPSDLVLCRRMEAERAERLHIVSQ